MTQPAQQTIFGLVAWLEETRVALPLKGVECQFDVTGDVACVQLDQIYHQNAARPLDCTYTFPLPAGAAVYRCEVHINGRVIRAKVEEQQAARELYQKHKAEGRRAALVETERENLFTLSLGNAQPGDMVVVRFAWFQVLDRIADQLRLMVPTCPGVRYIPGKPLLRALSGRGTADDTDQVPDASRISPPRIDALHPDAAYFSIQGRLSAADVKSGTASSPSHPVLVRKNEDAITVELAESGTVPDQDFVLSWKEPKVSQLAPTAWQWREGKDTYALVQLRAPEDVKMDDAVSQDFYFLVDRSGSMSGAKWQKCCEALHAFVRLLGPEDRVWITLFESEYIDFDVAPMPAPQVLADAGFQAIRENWPTGGTELLPAATHVLAEIAEHSTGRRANVILITDGQAGNEREIEKAFARAANVTVHTFGIDTAVNDAFLRSLARQQHGGCWLQTPNDDIAGTVAALGDRLRRPVLTDLRVQGSWDTANGTLPDLHAKEAATIALRGKKVGPVKFTGRLPDGTKHSFVVHPGNPGSEALKLLWARQRITALLASGQKAEAIALAKMHNLVCEGAAFVAWDEQEQVPIAGEAIVQPNAHVYHKELRDFEPDSSISYLSAPPLACDDTSFGEFYVPPRSDAAGPMFASLLEGPPLPERHGLNDVHAIFASDESPAPRRRRTRTPSPKELAAHKERERVKEQAALKKYTAEKFAELREALHREAVPESNIERFIAWAESDDVVNRTLKLFSAVKVIARAREYFGAIAAFDRVVRQMLSESPEVLLQWVGELCSRLDTLEKMALALVLAAPNPEVINRLVAWVAESGNIDPDRLERISEQLQSLRQGTFSANSKQRPWQRFLDLTVARAAC